MGFPIRKSPDQCSFAAPRSLSQLITSFIGSWCQGIPLALFFAWPSSKRWDKFRQASIAFGSVCLTPSPHRFSSSNSNLLALGFEFVKRTLGAQLSFARHFYFQSTILEKSMLLVLYYSWIMQAHYRISVFLAKIVFLPLQMIFIMSICKTFSLLLPSHNCIIIHNVQFSRCIWVLIPKRLNETSLVRCFSQSLWLIHSSLLLLTSEVVGQNGLAFLRESHAGWNSPPDCF